MSKIFGKDIWKEIEVIELNKINPDTHIPELYRYSLNSLNKVCGDNLPLVKFNLDFHCSRTIISDKYSYEYNMRGLFNTPLKIKLEDKKDESGWIYLYTNEQELNDGRQEKGWFWWYSLEYKCRIKIGRTGRHPIQRIREQQSTGVPHLPLILGLFWTPTIVTADNVLRDRLRPFMATNAGGSEWYKLKPHEALKIVLESIEDCRNCTKNNEVNLMEENIIKEISS
jgi:hypothetical protein